MSMRVPDKGVFLSLGYSWAELLFKINDTKSIAASILPFSPEGTWLWRGLLKP